MILQDFTLTDLTRMANARNYQSWMYERISPYLGQRVVEIGSGIGNFTRLLLDRELVVPVDSHRGCLQVLSQNLGDELKSQPLEIDVCDTSTMQLLRKYDFDTAICFNVIEHISNDVLALNNIHSAIRDGGRAIILVPAFQALFGTVDESLGHFRRYRRQELTSKMHQAGFVVQRAFYMNVIGMLGWFTNNKILRRREESTKQILFFDRYVAPMAKRLERLIPPPFGLSLIAVGVKGTSCHEAC
jgi:SAM-dependent methyltransferase